MLERMPAASVATHSEVMTFVSSLAQRGIGYVDAHLLASAALDGGSLWTLDQRLASVARDLGVH